MKIDPCTLEGTRIRLEPVAERHREPIITLGLAHPELWRYFPFAMQTRTDLEQRIASLRELHEQARGIFFATELKTTGEVIGGTSIWLTDPSTPTVEIGATFIAPRFQRTRANTEAKYLQLRHCFETLAVVRVELKTDARNLQSRAAMTRLGATEEGTLRKHMRCVNDYIRDSTYFSIVDTEWPQVKARLEAKLARAE